MEFGIHCETYFCICETEFMGQKCRPGDRIRWQYGHGAEWAEEPEESRIWAKIYFAPWPRKDYGQQMQAQLEWQFIGDVTQDHLTASMPKDAHHSHLMAFVALGLYRGMEHFLSLGSAPGLLVEPDNHFLSVYWANPFKDNQLRMLISPFSEIHADGCGDENPRIVFALPLAREPEMFLPIYALVSRGDYSRFMEFGENFFSNSVHLIQWSENIKFRPGSLVNFGLAAYLEFQQVRKQTQAGLRFADFLLYKNRIFRDCFCLDGAPEAKNPSREEMDMLIQANNRAVAIQELQALRYKAYYDSIERWMKGRKRYIRAADTLTTWARECPEDAEGLSAADLRGAFYNAYRGKHKRFWEDTHPDEE